MLHPSEECTDTLEGRRLKRSTGFDPQEGRYLADTLHSTKMILSWSVGILQPSMEAEAVVRQESRTRDTYLPKFLWTCARLPQLGQLRVQYRVIQQMYTARHLELLV